MDVYFNLASSLHERVQGARPITRHTTLQGAFPAMGELVRTDFDSDHHDLQGIRHFQ